MYGILIRNYYVVVFNALLWPLSLYYTMVTIIFIPTKEKQIFIIQVLVIGTFITLVASILSIVTLVDINFLVARYILGVLGDVFIALFYIAPLSAMKWSIQNKNSTKFQLSQVIVAGISGITWSVYGAKVNDYFILLPNLVGIVTSVVQVSPI